MLAVTHPIQLICREDHLCDQVLTRNRLTLKNIFASVRLVCFSSKVNYKCDLALRKE